LVLFRASCFGFRVKGVCPLLLPLVSLLSNNVACRMGCSFLRYEIFIAAIPNDHDASMSVSTLTKFTVIKRL
jgi:hypothetical protein